MSVSRRVVVTGLGLVTPLGVGVSENWNNLIDSKCGVKVMQDDAFAGLPTNLAARVPRGSGVGQFDSEVWAKGTIAKRIRPFTQFALCAAEEAFKDSGFIPQTQEQAEYTGACIGSGMNDIDDVAQSAKDLDESGFRKISPFFVPRILLNMTAGQLSIKYNLQGPNHAVSTACATGAHSIGDAMEMIKAGKANVMIAGGTEACITPLSVAGFGRAKALSTNFNDRPEEASRPFDKDRDGFVIGEGCGLVVLEEYEHAKARNAEIYCEIAGYGLTGDAHHITTPASSGRGAIACMKMALKEAHLDPASVQYINAHATSTRFGDQVENLAIKTVFNNQPNLAVSSSKGAIGHLLGAAGSVEAIYTILALKHNIAPPTLNLHETDNEDFSLNYVPLQAQDFQIDCALSNSFGFGGTNASLCFKKI